MILRIISILFLLNVVGCSTPLLLDKTRSLNEKGNGLVYATFGLDTSEKEIAFINGATAAFIEIDSKQGGKRNVKLNTNDEVWLAGGWKIPSITSATPDYLTLISAASLDEGDYLIKSLLIEIPLVSVVYRTSFPLKQPLYFSVKSGYATYIGHYSLKNSSGKNLFNQLVPSRVEFKTIDRFDADKDFLIKVRPEAVRLKFENALQ